MGKHEKKENCHACNGTGKQQTRPGRHNRHGSVRRMRRQRQGMSTGRELLAAVDRAAFIPDTIWVHRGDGYMAPLRRSEDSERWHKRVALDESVVTQVDDGAPEHGVFPTSSSSAPGVMTSMLDALDIAPGLRVLEIGTGTGYNAALLAEAVGGDNVTSIEVDPEPAEPARARVGRRRLLGDGDHRGRGGRACAGSPVRPGDRHSRGHHCACRLGRPDPPGRSAGDPMGCPVSGRRPGHPDGSSGRQRRGAVRGVLSFMRLREQRTPLYPNDDDQQSIETTTRCYPGEVFDDDAEAAFALAVQLPHCTMGHFGRDGARHIRLSDAATGSWAAYTTGRVEHFVRQEGPRRLWDELETAYRWWLDAGKPGHDRFGITVTADGQWVWLDTPEGPSWMVTP